MSIVNMKALKEKKEEAQKPEKQQEEEEKLSPAARLICEMRDFLRQKYDFKYNLMTREIEMKTEHGLMYLDDTEYSKMFFELTFAGYKVNDKLLEKILKGLVAEPYHPLRDYFCNLQWDGKDHIKALSDVIRIDHEQLKTMWYPYLRRWLVAVMAQALGHGSNHLCLVLAGAQGKGKTTFLNFLCPTELKEYLTCNHISPSLTDATTCNYLAEKFIVNIDDQLEVIFGKDYNSMKAILTASFVNNRKAFHRFSPQRERVCSFVGSVNNPQFLTDIHNRRYLVFWIDDIDLEGLKKIDISQVWAQARHFLLKGERYWLNQEEISQLNAINSMFRLNSHEEELLTEFFVPAKDTDLGVQYKNATQILNYLQVRTTIRLSQRKLTDALRLHGFEQKSKRVEGISHPIKCYEVRELTEQDRIDVERKLAYKMPSVAPDNKHEDLPF